MVRLKRHICQNKNRPRARVFAQNSEVITEVTTEVTILETIPIQSFAITPNITQELTQLYPQALPYSTLASLPAFGLKYLLHDNTSIHIVECKKHGTWRPRMIS